MHVSSRVADRFSGDVKQHEPENPFSPAQISLNVGDDQILIHVRRDPKALDEAAAAFAIIAGLLARITEDEEQRLEGALESYTAGDWHCVAMRSGHNPCGTLNPDSRDTCRACFADRPGETETVDPS